MKYIICATIIPEELEKELPGASPAAGRFLRNMKAGIEKKGYDVKECSFVALPGARECFKKHSKSTEGIVFKDKTIICSVRKYRKMVLCSAEPGDVVLFYNIVYFDLGLARALKKKGAIPVLILADFTEPFEENTGLIRSLIAMRVKKEFSGFDYGIALSRRATKFFNKSAKTIIMEGGINSCDYSDMKPACKEGITRFMYAGTLSKVTGVDMLLKAISMTGDETEEFLISGKGELEEQVRDAAERDPRIKFLGFMDDNEYLKILSTVHVFINPRNMSMLQNQNNFPSKVLEYLACGRPVISTRFQGYEDFAGCFEFADSTAEDIRNKIEQLRIKSNEYYAQVFENNTQKAHEYSWDKQAERIIALTFAQTQQ